LCYNRTMQPAISLKKVSKSFGKKHIIYDLSMDIKAGEFLTILGPSGSGKTIILRMISGLEPVTKGKIFFGDTDVTDIPAARRPVNTIFQNFALFPFLTVYENINFGLKMNHIRGKEAKKRIKNAIELVKLTGLEDRKPNQLSGGQQQRVAIARGIVMNHKILLLDESLASLDLNLKREMAVELKKLQQDLDMTFVYVTHDQNEAFTMSDRIAVINKGKLVQLDTPEEICNHPADDFIRGFISCA